MHDMSVWIVDTTHDLTPYMQAHLSSLAVQLIHAEHDLHAQLAQLQQLLLELLWGAALAMVVLEPEGRPSPQLALCCCQQTCDAALHLVQPAASRHTSVMARSSKRK